MHAYKRLNSFTVLLPNEMLDLGWVWIAMKRKKNVHLRFFYGFHALFIRPTSTDFNKFFFKIGFHGTIYTFKNYFAIVFQLLAINSF